MLQAPGRHRYEGSAKKSMMYHISETFMNEVHLYAD